MNLKERESSWEKLKTQRQQTCSSWFIFFFSHLFCFGHTVYCMNDLYDSGISRRHTVLVTGAREWIFIFFVFFLLFFSFPCLFVTLNWQ